MPLGHHSHLHATYISFIACTALILSMSKCHVFAGLINPIILLTAWDVLVMFRPTCFVFVQEPSGSSLHQHVLIIAKTAFAQENLPRGPE